MKWWTDSWNPIMGCSPLSPGCDNCYAARQAHQMSIPGSTTTKYAGLTEISEVKPPWTPPKSRPRFNGNIRVMSHGTKVWTQPERWRKPRTVFVCNMSDLFHPAVDFEYIARVFEAFVRAPRHLYLICTKRPRVADRFMRALNRGEVGSSACREELLNHGLFRNVWFGVTVEDTERAARRLPYLLGLREFFGGTFISHEPSLGWVEWYEHFRLRGDLLFPDWIVAGGESGPNARPTHPDWIRRTRDFCELCDIEFTFKQWGRWSPTDKTGKAAEDWADGEMPFDSDGTDCRGAESLIGDDTVLMRSIGKRVGGRELDGEVHEWAPTVEEVLG